MMNCAECGLEVNSASEFHPAEYCLLIKYGHSPKEIEYEIISQFVRRVNEKAEQNMEKTGKLEGSHYAAMQVELEKLARRCI